MLSQCILPRKQPSFGFLWWQILRRQAPKWVVDISTLIGKSWLEMSTASTTPQSSISTWKTFCDSTPILMNILFFRNLILSWKIISFPSVSLKCVRKRLIPFSISFLLYFYTSIFLFILAFIKFFISFYFFFRSLSY